jgi:N6-L-threonylcarbamoyladenine synthase
MRGKTLGEADKADLAAEFQAAAVDVLVTKSLEALEETGLRQLVVAGGVGANRLLRERLTRETLQRGCRVFYPPLELCTDNGAMIALAAGLRLKQNPRAHDRDNRGFTVRPRWDLEDLRPAAHP